MAPHRMQALACIIVLERVREGSNSASCACDRGCPQMARYLAGFVAAEKAPRDLKSALSARRRQLGFSRFPRACTCPRKHCRQMPVGLADHSDEHAAPRQVVCGAGTNLELQLRRSKRSGVLRLWRGEEARTLVDMVPCSGRWLQLDGVWGKRICGGPRWLMSSIATNHVPELRKRGSLLQHQHQEHC